MDFSAPQRRKRNEAIVPMINVVFLLLIFFLMSAQIAPPDPFEVTPPEAAAGENARASDTLYISAAGDMAFGQARGEAVFAALAARDGQGAPLQIRADADLAAGRLAALLPRFAALGITEIDLIAEAR